MPCRCRAAPTPVASPACIMVVAAPCAAALVLPVVSVWLPVPVVDCICGGGTRCATPSLRPTAVASRMVGCSAGLVPVVDVVVAAAAPAIAGKSPAAIVPSATAGAFAALVAAIAVPEFDVRAPSRAPVPTPVGASADRSGGGGRMAPSFTAPSPVRPSPLSFDSVAPIPQHPPL